MKNKVVRVELWLLLGLIFCLQSCHFSSQNDQQAGAKRHLRRKRKPQKRNFSKKDQHESKKIAHIFAYMQILLYLCGRFLCDKQ